MNSDKALADNRSDRQQLIMVAGCFLLSGFAALLYETVWLRQFSIYFGTSEQVLAIVLGTYMGGLALGSLIAARVATHLRRPLLTYGLLELGIAVTALLVPFSLAMVRRIQILVFGGADQPPAAGELDQILFSFAGAFAATILPTTMMGATLPMLAKHVVHRNDHLGNRIGALYAINTLGAVFGTLTCAFLCLPRLGLIRTVFVGVAINIIVFLIVWLIVRAPRGESAALGTDDSEKAGESSGDARAQRRVERKSTRPRRVQKRNPGTAAGRNPKAADASASRPESRAWILWLIAISGAVSFGYEILFTRMLGHILGGSVFAFASMLASFLLGIAIGGAIAARLARDSESSSLGFFYAQCGTVCLALVSWYSLESFAELINEANSAGSTQWVPRPLWAMLILLPPATTIGMTLPWAIRIHARDQRDAAGSSARVYAWNVLGGVVGAFLMGTYLLPLTNYQVAMLAALSANLVIALLLLTRAKLRLVHLSMAVACAIVIAVGLPSQPDELLRVSSLKGFRRTGELVFVWTGRSATVTMHNDAGTFLLSTNGLREAGAKPKGSLIGSDSTDHWLGVLPALLRPTAKTMLVVGFGGGVAPASAPQSIRKIDVFELEQGVIEANRLIADERERDPLSDPRINVILNDGRSGLALTGKDYDIIVSQPSHPWTAGASHLYTQEFAELVREHLTPQGVFVLWMDCQFIDAQRFRSLGATLAEVFPQISLFRPDRSTLLFVGSRSALELPIEPMVVTNEQDRSVIQQLGVDTPTALMAARSLDDASMRRMCKGARLTTDNNNLLALHRIDLERRNETALEISRMINRFDPLLQSSGTTDLHPAIDRAALIVRRRLMGHHENADLLAQISDQKEQLFATAVSAWSGEAPHEAAELFQQIIQADPTNEHAWVFLFLLSQSGTISADQIVDYATIKANVSMPYAAIADASKYIRAKQTAKMMACDEVLATIPVTDPLFVPVTLLRISWRDADESAGSPQQRGLEILELIDRVSPYANRDDLLMLRLRAAALANRPFIALTTAQAVANSVGNQLYPEKMGTTGEAAENPVDFNLLRAKLMNCMNVIARFEGDRRVPAHRFYGVQMYVESQLRQLPPGNEG